MKAQYSHGDPRSLGKNQPEAEPTNVGDVDSLPCLTRNIVSKYKMMRRHFPKKKKNSETMRGINARETWPRSIIEK